MRRFLRRRVAGGTFFITVVTDQRRPILTGDCARRCLRQAFRRVRCRRPFRIMAIVLLPDHWHTILELPPGDDDYSTRIRQVKESFTRRFLAEGGVEGERSASRYRKRERAIWQRRFYEHTVRDEDDLKRCADYLHYNPVKHGHVSRVADWAWSSFHRFVRMGEYPPDWGGVNPLPGVEFGE